jgi:hypothetical protein
MPDKRQASLAARAPLARSNNLRRYAVARLIIALVVLSSMFMLPGCGGKADPAANADGTLVATLLISANRMIFIDGDTTQPIEFSKVVFEDYELPYGDIVFTSDEIIMAFSNSTEDSIDEVTLHMYKGDRCPYDLDGDVLTIYRSSQG